MDFESLISRCIAKMEAENLTNRDVAQRAKISESTVYRTLSSRGANTTAATITAICDALGVTADTAQYEVVERSATKDEVYEARIADLKSVSHNKDQWIKALFIVCVCLTIFICTIFAVDILNPAVGWFRG